MFAISVTFGAKRTCCFALHMSAFDPKRTSAAGTFSVRRTVSLCAQRFVTPLVISLAFLEATLQ